MEFNAIGLSLAYAVYEELNKEHHVKFQGETLEGGLDEPIEINSL